MEEHDIEELEVIGQLSDGQYWKWRLTIEEMDHYRTKERAQVLEYKLRETEVELMKSRLALLKPGVQAAHTNKQKAVEEYQKHKSELEEELGLSLNDCVIDEYTFKIKKQPTTTKEGLDGTDSTT